jgi:ATP-dependent Lhr-like helicase
VPRLAVTLGFSIEDVEIALAQLEGEGQVLRGSFTPQACGGEIEWCNRRVLARIHRMTVARLRREIEPVTAQQFHTFLTRWQHVATGTRLHGVDGLLEIVRQLQGYEAPAAAWEQNVLAQRIAGYEPEMLDELCLSGEVTWARVSPHPALESGEGRIRASRVAPITVMLREDAGWLHGHQSDAAESPALSATARDLVTALDRGAQFFVDLVRDTERPANETEDALWELVTAGLVTADGFDNLRALIDPQRRRGDDRARVRRRPAAGRWALVPRTKNPHANRVERWCEQLLIRWGVVFRDLLARESAAPPWRELAPKLRQMEARGQIRGGRFVAGFTGEQFARPEAIDLLRAVRRTEAMAAPAQIAGADPLNLVGIILPGTRVSPLTSSIAVLA